MAESSLDNPIRLGSHLTAATQDDMLVSALNVYDEEGDCSVQETLDETYEATADVQDKINSLITSSELDGINNSISIEDLLEESEEKITKTKTYTINIATDGEKINSESPYRNWFLIGDDSWTFFLSSEDFGEKFYNIADKLEGISATVTKYKISVPTRVSNTTTFSYNYNRVYLFRNASAANSRCERNEEGKKISVYLDLMLQQTNAVGGRNFSRCSGYHKDTETGVVYLDFELAAASSDDIKDVFDDTWLLAYDVNDIMNKGTLQDIDVLLNYAEDREPENYAKLMAAMEAQGLEHLPIGVRYDSVTKKVPGWWPYSASTARRWGGYPVKFIFDYEVEISSGTIKEEFLPEVSYAVKDVTLFNESLVEDGTVNLDKAKFVTKNYSELIYSQKVFNKPVYFNSDLADGEGFINSNSYIKGNTTTLTLQSQDLWIKLYNNETFGFYKSGSIVPWGIISAKSSTTETFNSADNITSNYDKATLVTGPAVYDYTRGNYLTYLKSLFPLKNETLTSDTAYSKKEIDEKNFATSSQVNTQVNTLIGALMESDLVTLTGEQAISNKTIIEGFNISDGGEYYKGYLRTDDVSEEAGQKGSWLGVTDNYSSYDAWSGVYKDTETGLYGFEAGVYSYSDNSTSKFIKFESNASLVTSTNNAKLSLTNNDRTASLELTNSGGTGNNASTVTFSYGSSSVAKISSSNSSSSSQIKSGSKYLVTGGAIYDYVSSLTSSTSTATVLEQSNTGWIPIRFNAENPGDFFITHNLLESATFYNYSFIVNADVEVGSSYRVRIPRLITEISDGNPASCIVEVILKNESTAKSLCSQVYITSDCLLEITKLNDTEWNYNITPMSYYNTKTITFD